MDINKKNPTQTLNLISLGCAKNLVDSEILIGGLRHMDVNIVDEPENADTIVVNTCGFLDQAREESIEVILQAAELKNTGRLQQLVVMGCLSERYPEELKKKYRKWIVFSAPTITVRLFNFSRGSRTPKMIPCSGVRC